MYNTQIKEKKIVNNFFTIKNLEGALSVQTPLTIIQLYTKPIFKGRGLHLLNKLIINTRGT